MKKFTREYFASKGRIGGSSKSPKKIAAVIENLKKVKRGKNFSKKSGKGESHDRIGASGKTQNQESI